MPVVLEPMRWDELDKEVYLQAWVRDGRKRDPPYFNSDSTGDDVFEYLKRKVQVVLAGKTWPRWALEEMAPWFDTPPEQYETCMAWSDGSKADQNMEWRGVPNKRHRWWPGICILDDRYRKPSPIDGCAVVPFYCSELAWENAKPSWMAAVSRLRSIVQHMQPAEPDTASVNPWPTHFTLPWDHRLGRVASYPAETGIPWPYLTGAVDTSRWSYRTDVLAPCSRWPHYQPLGSDPLIPSIAPAAIFVPIPRYKSLAPVWRRVVVTQSSLLRPRLQLYETYRSSGTLRDLQILTNSLPPEPEDLHAYLKLFSSSSATAALFAL